MPDAKMFAEKCLEAVYVVVTVLAPPIGNRIRGKCDLALGD
jgi:hypothetical protein